MNDDLYSLNFDMTDKLYKYEVWHHDGRTMCLSYGDTTNWLIIALLKQFFLRFTFSRVEIRRNKLNPKKIKRHYEKKIKKEEKGVL